MYEIFEKLLIEKGLRPADVTRATGLSSVVFSDWKSGKSKPNTEKMVKIARFLNVSVDYLVTGDEKLKLDPNEYTHATEVRELVEYYTASSDDDKKVIWAVLDKYKKESQ